MKSYKLKKIYKNLKVFIKMEKTNVTFRDIEIGKQRIHQHKRPISINNIDIDKIIVSNTVSFAKKGFKYFIGYNNAKKNLYAYFLQKRVHIEETLMKLNICIF